MVPEVVGGVTTVGDYKVEMCSNRMKFGSSSYAIHQNLANEIRKLSNDSNDEMLRNLIKI